MSQYKNPTAPPVTPEMTPPKPASSQIWIPQALATVQEGLKSIQALQQQTASAHEKFLETQAESNRTLQAMIQSTRGITAGEHTAAASPPSNPVPPMNPHQVSIPETVTQPAAPSTPGATPLQAKDGKIDIKPSPPAPVPVQTTPAGVATPDPVATRLLEVVSELTGYPVPMLDLDMDIESDLGIDSIKRVEILSTLEEQMPHLPSVSPEIMGSLKTLGQISNYLEKGSSKVEGPVIETENHIDDQNPIHPGPVDSTPAATIGNPDQGTIQEKLLNVVSDLTGYPGEMLGLEMDIESDLGIDSIKRVEILSSLEEKMPHLPAISPDQMGQLKTLADIIAFLSRDAKAIEESAPGSEVNIINMAPPSENLDELVSQPSPVGDTTLERRAIAIRPAPFNPGPAISVATRDKHIVLIAAPSPLGQALVANLSDTFDHHVKQFTWKEAAQALESLPEEFSIGGLVMVSAPEFSQGIEMSAELDGNLKTAFQWTRRFARGFEPEQDTDSSTLGGLLATVSFLDGAFGFKGEGVASPMSGGLAGLVKTAALEWPDVLCRAFDLDTHWQDWQQAADQICAELMTPEVNGPIEVGLGSDLPPGHRNLLMLETMDPVPTSSSPIQLDHDDVVIVTGGARGITASALEGLARQCPATYVLLGRSAAPFPEPAWLQGLIEPGDIKAAIVREEKSGEGTPLTPKELEPIYQYYVNNREITTSLKSLSRNGVKIFYHSVDVRDTKAMKALGNSIQKSHGPVTAVIHAAGIVHDRHIRDKTRTQFDDVFDTKVHGLFNLLAAVEPSQLKYMVLFSSITARVGNIGQVDYAMANEVMNKIAQGFAVKYPNANVKSLNWGPWEGGMVTPSLKKAFAQRGVDLISLNEGAVYLLAEMGDKNPAGPVEIVVGADLSQSQLSQPHPPEHRPPPQVLSVPIDDPMKTTFIKQIDLARFPILGDHRLDGIPVVPFALMAEWLAHGALHDNPGLTLVGLDDMRLMAGIRLDEPSKEVELRAAKALRKNGFFEVPVELRESKANDHLMIHCRARAVLAEARPKPSDLSPRIPQRNGRYSRSVEEVYRDVLFHGNGLQGIGNIVSLSSEGMTAEVASAPRPTNWLREPLRSRWLADPLVLDSAFQMASLWCFEQNGSVSLPSYAARYRQFCSSFPPDGATIHLRVDQVQTHKITADITFMDRKGAILAVMEGFEAVMDGSLMKAFKPQNAA